MKNQDFLTDLYGKVLHALLPLRSILKFVNRDVLQLTTSKQILLKVESGSQQK